MNTQSDSRRNSAFLSSSGKSFRRKVSFFLLFCAVVLILCGCGKEGSGVPVKVRALSGDQQCTMPREKFSEPLKIVLEDEAGNPVANCKMLVSVRSDSDLVLEKGEFRTDRDGILSLQLSAGKTTGDHYLLIAPARFPKKQLEVRFITGLSISGTKQETGAGRSIPEPLSVRIVKSDGSPAVGIPVYFTLGGAPDGAKAILSPARTLTNADGVASAEVTAGNATGCYDIEINVAGQECSFRPIRAQVLGLNLVQLLFGVGGGLGLFIFGMKLMSDGLRNAAGERIRGILRFFSKNRYIAMVAGIFITIALQSSSATTVMLVGFINAGLMDLAQSIGIMLGAHIGTTITAQLIAFKLDSLIMPAIILGLIITFIPWQKLRGVGETIFGFGLLFFGMKIMSGELKAIADFPSFIEFFRIFDCSPVNGHLPFGAVYGAILIGMLVTMIIQGSSATAGIVIALGAGGLINLYTAVALVLGSNIGTTITAVLAAIPANRVAKQAALANSLCAIIGVIVVSASFWISFDPSGVPVFFALVNKISGGAAPTAQNIARYIANSHTLFNVITSLMLMPFIHPIARLAERMIPASGKVKFQYLEPHLLSNPAIALEQSVNVLRRMLGKACRMVDRAEGFFIRQTVDPEKFAVLARKENRIDKLQFEITNYLTQIMQQKLSPPQANVIPVLMHCTNDAERIADHTENILQLTSRLVESGHTISKSAVHELEELRILLEEQSNAAVILLGRFDASLVRRALEIEKIIAAQADHFEDTHIQRLRERTCQAEVGVIFIEMLNEINKTSARLSNIVERAGRINRTALGFHHEAEEDSADDDEA